MNETQPRSPQTTERLHLPIQAVPVSRTAPGAALTGGGIEASVNGWFPGMDEMIRMGVMF